jgi:hypothetical protein
MLLALQIALASANPPIFGGDWHSLIECRKGPGKLATDEADFRSEVPELQAANDDQHLLHRRACYG